MCTRQIYKASITTTTITHTNTLLLFFAENVSFDSTTRITIKLHNLEKKYGVHQISQLNKKRKQFSRDNNYHDHVYGII